MYRYFINYSAIAFIVILAAFMFFFSFVLDLYLDREHQENSAKLERAKQALDLQFKACIDIKYKIDHDYLFSYQTLTGTITSVESVKMLNNMINHTEIFDTIIVIYDAPGIDHAYSSSGTIEIKYFDQYFAMDPVKYADIIKIIQSKEQPVFCLLGKRPEPGYSSERILLVFPSGSQYRSLGVLFHINKSEFDEILAEPYANSHYQTYIADNQNNVIFAQSNYDGITYDQLSLMIADSPEKEIKLSRNESAYVQHSDQLDMKYVVVIQHQGLLQRTMQIGSVILYVMIAILLLALIISYMMAKKSYQPIKRILHNLIQCIPRDGSDNDNEVKNEFDYIDQVIQNIYPGDSSGEKLKNSEYIINSKLSMLFSGGYDSFCDRDIYQELGLDNEASCFMILLISVDNKKRYLREYPTTKRNEIITSFRRYIAQQLEGMTALFFLSPIVNMTACFLSLNQFDPEQGQSHVYDAVKGLQEYSQRIYNITVTLTISKPYHDIKESQKLFYYIVNAAKYKYTTGDNSIIDTNSEHFAGPFVDLKVNSMIFDLYQHLIDDDVDQMRIVLDHIIEMLAKSYSPFLLSNVYTNVLSVFERVNNNLIHNEKFCRLLDQYIRIEPETEQELRDVFSQCIDCFTQARNDIKGDEATKARIMEQIQEQYTDPALSLYSISDQVNMSVSSLSKFIKKAFGTNFLLMVNDLRLQKARELLIKTNLAVNEIAAASGFNDISNFNRKFKSAESVTPTEYRKLHQNDVSRY